MGGALHSYSMAQSPFMSVEDETSGLSYTRGADRPLLELTIGDLLKRTAERNPDGAAVVSRHQGARMTWS